MKRIIKNDTKVMLLFTFLIISILYIQPKGSHMHSGVISNKMQQRTEKKESQIRTDFVNEHGIITFATDLGYATKISINTENGVIEKYYDELENPVERTGGYYAVLYEYDDNKKIKSIIYLNKDDKPIIISTGYSKLIRTYYENGRLKSEKYYDMEGNPIKTNAYGFGKLIEYDDARCAIKITYLDEREIATKTGLGYAIIMRTYYNDNTENGRVKHEFYFDENGKPIKLSLGQYGIYKEYDVEGFETSVTYLDANGDPMTTTKGYAKVLHSFDAKNSATIEMYLGLNGNPVCLKEGQYGIKMVNGQIIYLNAEGKEIFNLKRVIYNNPYSIFFIVLVLFLFSIILDKKLNIIILILYLCAISYLTLMFRERDNNQIKTGIFWSYKQFFTNESMRSDIIKNIWLFIPLGMILYRIMPKRRVLILPIIISAFIECLQFITKTGFCEFDDVISNSLGGVIGYQVGYLLNKKLRQHRTNRLKAT